MTLQCWNPLDLPLPTPKATPTGPSTSSFPLLTMANQAEQDELKRCRSMSSAFETTDTDEDDGFDLMSSTLPATMPSLPSLPLPAQRIHGRRRSNSRHGRHRRRRAISDNSSSHSPATPTPALQPPQRRLRILTPVASKIYFGGWVRGQPADVRWEVVDKSVQSVRIDVCNVAWNVPTTIAHHIPNDGHFQWKRVYWGMPIADGYYVNIYDASEVSETGEMPLLAQSEGFAVIG